MRKKLMTNKLLPSKRAASGYKYIIYDSRPGAKNKPWSVCAPNFRSKGFATREDAAEHYSRLFHPDWWQKPHIKDSEVDRMALFGIRLTMKLKKKSYNGTVIAYFPATQEHIIRFDNSDKLYYFHLMKENNWKRIPWNNNTLDATSEIGEVSNDTYISFGPDCPKCAAFLGVGASAWSKCHMCSHNEPGSCIWGLQ